MRAPASAPCEILEPRRLFAGSNLDPSFGQAGVGVLDVGRATVIDDVVEQPDGKLLLAGRQGSNGVLARVNADGSVDAAFGTFAGFTKFDLGANETFEHLAILPDGKILAAGNTRAGTRTRGFVARFSAAGALDTDFGSGDGIVMLPQGQPLQGFAASTSKFFTVTGDTLRRHNLGTGSLDVGFDADGQVSLLVAGGLITVFPNDLALSPDGARVAVVGYGESIDATEKKLPQRFEQDKPKGSLVVMRNAGTGAPDNAFDGNGVGFNDGSQIPRPRFAPDGDLLVANDWREFQPNSGPGVFRFKPDGTYTFSSAPTASSQPTDVRALADGHVMLVSGGGVATRFKADGALDASYSNDGAVSVGNVSDLPGAGAVGGVGGSALDDGSVLFVQSFERDPQETGSAEGAGPIVLGRLLADPPADPQPQVALGSDGTLAITATDGSDNVSVNFESDAARVTVHVNQDAFRFAIGDVKAVSATLGDGDDLFGMEGASDTVAARVDGEAGDDVLLGGAGPDTLIGGLGRDHLYGYGGVDSLYGNGGKDTLEGGDSDDRLDGGSGNDLLHGGAQPDRLVGGTGSDELFGEGGADRFSAAGDNAIDYVTGGPGFDTATVDASLDVLASIERAE